MAEQTLVEQAVVEPQAVVNPEQAALVENHEAVASPEANSVHETAEAAPSAPAIEAAVEPVIDSAIEYKSQESSLEVSAEEIHQVEQPAVSVESVSAETPGAEAVTAEAVATETASVEASAADVAPGATSSDASVPASAQVSQSAQPSTGDDELMAALASLAPAHGGTIESVQHGAYGSNGSGRDLATSTPVAEIFSGPRWIAELVELGPEESKLALDLEMAHELAARATVEAASTSSIATVADAVSAISVSVAEPVEAIAAEASAVGAQSESQVHESQAHESQTVEAAAVDAVALGTSANQENASPAVEEPAYAAAAAAGAGTDHFAPAEIVSATTAVPENNAAAQATGTPQREAELAAAWQNWKQIRESFVSSQPPAAETETKSDREELAASAQAAPVDEVAELEEAKAAEVEVAESEAAENDAPEESTAIASIVDSMLAELRPKLVEEIAKKMNSEKKSKEKKKKK